MFVLGGFGCCGGGREESWSVGKWERSQGRREKEGEGKKADKKETNVPVCEARSPSVNS